MSVWDVAIPESELADARAEAEIRMTSRATIHRLIGSEPGANGFQVDTYEVILTDVPFRLAGAERGGSGARTVRVGESEVEVAVRVAHFPASTTGLLDNDLIEVTAGENVGAVLRIIEASWADQQTARRVPVVEVQRPEAWT